MTIRDSIQRLDDGRLLIVGKRIDENTPLGDIGDDQDAVIISPDLLGEELASSLASDVLVRLQGEIAALKAQNGRWAESLANALESILFEDSDKAEERRLADRTLAAALWEDYRNRAAVSGLDRRMQTPRNDATQQQIARIIFERIAAGEEVSDEQRAGLVEFLGVSALSGQDGDEA